MSAWAGTWTHVIDTGRNPDNETGIYLRKHTHRWRESGLHRWPNGSSQPTFTCTRCGDIICTDAAAGAGKQ